MSVLQLRLTTTDNCIIVCFQMTVPWQVVLFLKAAARMVLPKQNLDVKHVNAQVSSETNQDPVVQKPLNANLGLKVNQGFCFSC